MTRHRVLQSVNASTGDRCVDIFRRSDGSFGFEEYRRDPEDPRGWFPIGGYAHQRFRDADSADRAARAAVAWYGEMSE